MLRRRGVDEVLEPDEELEEVHVTSSSGSDRMQKLMSKKSTAVRSGVDKNWDNCMIVQSGIICVKCGMIFFPAVAEEWVVCPNCQARQHMEPVEEVSILNPNQDMERAERLMQKAERQKRRKGFALGRQADTHFNDAKDQFSLQLGSAEYREYLEDLQDHNPMKANDEFHEKLAKHNEQVPVVLQQANDSDGPVEEFLERKAQDEVGKLQLHRSAIGAVAMMAAFTQWHADDAVVERIGTDNAAMKDVNVRPDEYQDALKNLVVELSR